MENQLQKVHPHIEAFYKAFHLFRPFVQERTISYKVPVMLNQTLDEAKQLIEANGWKLKASSNIFFKLLFIQVADV